MQPPKTSVILFAHGSKASEANDGIARLAEDLARRSGFPTAAAFLEIASPDLSAAVASARAGGARRVILVPCFLTMGMHVRQDLPRLVQTERDRYPDLEILVSLPMEGHPGLSEILFDRVSEALAGSSGAVQRKD
jgi:sirohydrochlorin ferrochelatase